MKGVTGTIRLNRFGGLPLFSGVDMNQKISGSSDEFVGKDDIVVLKWFDDKSVCLLILLERKQKINKMWKKIIYNL